MSKSAEPFSEALTIPYKCDQGITVYLDIYPPRHLSNPLTNGASVVPAVVFFHGGGLTCGNRRSWFPQWLKPRVTSAGYALISADYRLMVPSDAQDIVDDIRDLFRFLANDLNVILDKRVLEAGLHSFRIDANCVAVAGSSAGGLCAYLAAVHAIPKPKAVLGLYAMGGDFLTPHYLCPKDHVFFRGREILDPANYQEFMYPRSSEIAVIADSPLAYDPPTAPIPGFPSNPRMLLARLYLQLGVVLDYYLGVHDPSISAKLRDKATLHDVNHINHSVSPPVHHLIPEQYISLLPQLNVDANWPPTYLLHGEIDSAVPVHDSRHMYKLIKDAGVPVTLEVVEGREHSFDLVPDAEVSLGPTFDTIMTFLESHLKERS